jgi:hypothetical protein
VRFKVDSESNLFIRTADCVRKIAREIDQAEAAQGDFAHPTIDAFVRLGNPALKAAV